ncbi:MAG: hypothetical protein HY567_01325 [Candidatus Kerfeldbacteria bacterium]|nr:hypothetical protein [Candidatus Kerfeldbacteria bacterium]
MRCPRCGTENHTPEATGYRCFQCGFLLHGEVALPGHDIRSIARRRNALRLLTIIVVLGGVGYAWYRDWFGMLPWQQQFVVSDHPEQAAVLGAGSVSMNVGGVSALFSREALWSVDALALGRHATTGPLGPFAPRTVVVAWGPAASVRLKSLTVASVSGGTRVTSADALIDPSVFATAAGAVRVLATNDAVQQRLQRLRPGNHLRLEGYLVAGAFDDQRVAATAPASGERNAPSYLLELTYLEVNGKAAP